MKQLCESTGATISVQKIDGPPHYLMPEERTVTIYGKEEQQKAARTKIADLVTTVRTLTREELVEDAHPMEEPAMTRLYIPNEEAGCVIGRRGWIADRIAVLSETQIYV